MITILLIVYLVFGYMVTLMFTPANVPRFLAIVALPALVIVLTVSFLFLEINSILKISPNLKEQWEKEKTDLFN